MIFSAEITGISYSLSTCERKMTSASYEAKPFTWTADPDKIIAAVKRGHHGGIAISHADTATSGLTRLSSLMLDYPKPNEPFMFSVILLGARL
jgi:hypothetical protein